MWARICRRVLLVGTGIILSLTGTSHGGVTVVNYDNHPDLEKAKEYDLTVENERFRRADGSFDRELYKSYVARASRELAEKHYLAYLKDVDESFQRAAVYAQLGGLFSGGVSPHVAKTIDRDKARVYYRKALEAEPERIGWPTLQARGFLATDANTREERFASYMDYYQWLLSIDEKTLKEKALPMRPPGTRLPKARPVPELDEAQKELVEQLRKRGTQLAPKRPAQPQSSGGGFLGLIKDQAEVTARNLVHEAVGRMAIDPETTLWSEARAIQHLIMLAERFPDASVAERAKAELARIASAVADDALSISDDGLNVNGPAASLPTSSHVDANQLEAEARPAAAPRPEDKRRLSNAQTDPNNELGSVPASQKGKETRRASIFAWCVGFIALVAMSLCVARRRASAHPSGRVASDL